jgi:hypothetical protein
MTNWQTLDDEMNVQLAYVARLLFFRTPDTGHAQRSADRREE